jgi:DNA-3-methyladenine glycosylase I
MHALTNTDEIVRCPWNSKDGILTGYHDQEWGTPLHDDQLLFEHLTLDGFQAGLSWSIILNKREAFRNAFDHFDPLSISNYDTEKIDVLMKDPGIVRNSRKIEAAIGNARAFLQVQKETGSFDKYIWSFTGGKTIHNHWDTLDQIPTVSPEAEAMSVDLKQRGFRFVGPTICYAFMQAVGMVNDHLVTCFRHAELDGS